MSGGSRTVLNRLLDEALELPPSERLQWVDRLGTEHAGIRQRVRELLSGGLSLGRTDFLATIPKFETTVSGSCEPPPDLLSPDQTVGPYRLLRRLAEGGMGTVWLAERADGMLNRPVAVKLPKGLWPLEGLAERMARERAILATLDHPNIARLYDAGLTGAGQPFLALEYVAGRPIDEYVSAGRLSLTARLQLFLQVARAVAHAHARLVIHRDLKPSNILVTDAGDVKLLDFGIAKLVDAGVGDSSVTEAGVRALTPDYASPEQIAGEPLGVATDVYSLGVLLYRMLTSRQPYPARCGSRRALEDAILRTDPVRPSDAVAEPGAQRALRGDLDTILLKALEKRTDDRYESVNAFADDITRHLQGYAVLARPDFLGYRVRKFVARHRLGVAVSTATFCLLVAVGGYAAWQARALAEQEQVTRLERDKAERVVRVLVDLFETTNPSVRPDGDRMPIGEFLAGAEARALAQLEGAPVVGARLRQVFGLINHTRGNYAPARQSLEDALAEQRRLLGPDHPDALASLLALGEVLRDQGDAVRARPLLEESLDRHRRRYGDVHERTAQAISALAALESDSDLEKGAALYSRALRINEQVLSPGHPAVLANLGALASYHQQRGEFGRARDLLVRALAIDAPAARAHPATLQLMNTYASVLGELGENAAAETVQRKALALAVRILGRRSLTVADLTNDLGVTLTTLGRRAEAERAFREAFDLHVSVIGEHHWRSRNVARNVGRVLALQLRYEEALPWMDRAVATRVPEENTGGAGRAFVEAQRAMILFRLGRRDAALAQLARSVEVLEHVKEKPGYPMRALAMARVLLARALTDTGRPDRAVPLLVAAMDWYGRLALDQPARAGVDCELARARLLHEGDAGQLAVLRRCAPVYRRWGQAETEVAQSFDRLLDRQPEPAARTANALVPSSR